MTFFKKKIKGNIENPPLKKRETKLLSKGKNDFSHCALFLARHEKDSGILKLFLLNIGLFLSGFILLSLGSFFILSIKSVYLCSLILILENLFMIFKFDAHKIRTQDGILKLIFIIFSLFMRSCTLMTYSFLIIFENISAFYILEGFNIA